MDPKTVYTHAVSIATAAAGYVVAFVPSMATDKRVLITAGSIAIAVVILIADAVKNKPASESVLTATETEVKSVLSTVDFGPVVQKELTKLLGTTVTAPATPPSA